MGAEGDTMKIVEREEGRGLSNRRQGGGEGCRPLLQVRLPEVLGDVHGNVQEREISDGKALTLEAEREERVRHWTGLGMVDAMMRSPMAVILN